jgi:hypothetical protein
MARVERAETGWESAEVATATAAMVEVETVEVALEAVWVVGMAEVEREVAAAEEMAMAEVVARKGWVEVGLEETWEVGE